MLPNPNARFDALRPCLDLMSESNKDRNQQTDETERWRDTMGVNFEIFDFDKHYYEAPDAFTRYQDRSLGYRGVRWADIDGKRRVLVEGIVNSYVANFTFDPVAHPGALYDWYRRNILRVRSLV